MAVETKKLQELTKEFQKIATGASQQFGYATGYLELWAKYNSQDIAKNTTNYTVELRLVVYGGYIGNYQATYYSLSSTGLSDSSGNSGSGDYTSRTITSITGNVTHDEKGTKSITSSGSFSPTAWGKTLSISGSADLPAIPRVSDIAIDKESVNVGDILNIRTTKKYSEFIDKLTINFGGFTKSIENIVDGYAWDTNVDADDLYSQMPTENSLKGNITIETFSGENSVGTKSIDFSLNVVNSNPIFNNFTYEDTNPKILGLTGDNQTIVKGYSNVKGIVTMSNNAVAINGATMKKYRFVVGEKQSEFSFSNTEDVNTTIQQVLNNVFTMYAIDSRNNSTMKQLSPAIYLDYKKPTILNVNFERSLGGVGENVTLSIIGEFWNNNFGLENNKIEISYKFKNTESDEWLFGTTEIIPTIDGNNYYFSGEIAGDLPNTGFDVENSYDVIVIVSDKLDYTQNQDIVGSGTPNLAMHKNGTAFGGIYDELLGGLLQIAGVKMAEKVGNDLKVFANYSLENGKRLLTEGEVGGGSGLEEIIENEYGTALKYSDGRLIQYGLQNKGSISFNTDWWGQFTRADNMELLEITFPIEFKEIEYCDYVPKTTNTIKVNNTTMPTTKGFVPYLIVPKNNTGNKNTLIYFYAFGTWKDLEVGGGSSGSGGTGGTSITINRWEGVL